MPVMPSTHDETPGHSHDHDNLRTVRSDDDVPEARIEPADPAIFRSVYRDPIPGVPEAVREDVLALCDALDEAHIDANRASVVLRGWIDAAVLERGRTEQAEAALAYAREALGRWETDFPCDAHCVDAPEEDCTRHGRHPAELWAMASDIQSQRDQARAALARVEALPTADPAHRGGAFATGWNAALQKVRAAIAGDGPLRCARCGRPGREHEGDLFNCPAGDEPRSPLPSPNPLMAATLDGEPAAPLIAGDPPAAGGHAFEPKVRDELACAACGMERGTHAIARDRP